MDNINKQQSFWKEERGDFGVKGIAITIAVIVLIGAIITIIQANLDGWIAEIWTMFIDQIKKLFE